MRTLRIVLSYAFIVVASGTGAMASDGFVSVGDGIQLAQESKQNCYNRHNYKIVGTPKARWGRTSAIVNRTANRTTARTAPKAAADTTGPEHPLRQLPVAI